MSTAGGGRRATDDGSVARESSTAITEYEAEPGQYSGAGPEAEAGRTILEVEVVPELCMSFMNCMRIATGAFQTDRGTQRTCASERWKQVDAAKLWRAGWSCPTGAIRFVTDRGYVVPRWDEAARWRIDGHPAAGRRSGDVPGPASRVPRSNPDAVAGRGTRHAGR